MIRRLSVVAAAVCVLGGTAHAAPVLEGHVLETSYLFPDTETLICAGVNATVGAGVELENYCRSFDIDFSNVSIRITLDGGVGVNDVEFDGLQFFDVAGTIPDDLIATVNPATTYAGFDASRLGGDENTLLVNIANLQPTLGQFILIDLAPSEPGGPVVPEPATLTLLGGGVAALVARRRHSRPRAAGGLR